jgi:hypothetical protein
MALDLYENWDNYPLTINDAGFVLPQFENLIETQTLTTGSTNVIKFLVYASDIQHASLYTDLTGGNNQISQSNVQILYNNGQPLQVIDYSELLDNATVTVNEIDSGLFEIVFELTFLKEMDTSNMILRVWNQYLQSSDVHVLDAINVVPQNQAESPFSFSDEPEILELQTQTIPIWIKNNAAWWAEQQIADSDFAAGIEYMIKNGIITVPGVEVGTSSAEVPDWIKNNASWWSESLITDEDFIEAMQWLVSTGVIQI